jgi:hypothetical protein
MVEHAELLAIHRALDELSRQARRFAEDVARLRAESALLLHANDPEPNPWADDEGLGGFASTLGRSA